MTDIYLHHRIGDDLIVCAKCGADLRHVPTELIEATEAEQDDILICAPCYWSMHCFECSLHIPKEADRHAYKVGTQEVVLCRECHGIILAQEV